MVLHLVYEVHTVCYLPSLPSMSRLGCFEPDDLMPDAEMG